MKCGLTSAVYTGARTRGVLGDDHTISDAGQEALGFIGHLSTLFSLVQLAADQYPQLLFCWAAFQALLPKSVLLHEIVVT